MERHPSTSSCNCGAKLQMLQFGYVWIRTKYGTFWTQGACDFSRKFTLALWACGDCDVLGINVVKECGENQSARVILMNFKLRIDLSWQFLRFANWHLNWKSTFFRLEEYRFQAFFQGISRRKMQGTKTEEKTCNETQHWRSDAGKHNRTSAPHQGSPWRSWPPSAPSSKAAHVWTVHTVFERWGSLEP